MHEKMQIPVRRMAQKKFSLSSHSRSDVLMTFDVFLTPIDHTDIACNDNNKLLKNGNMDIIGPSPLKMLANSHT